MAERGAAFVENGVVEQPYSIAAGRAGMRGLMTLSQPPTAVLCGNDVLALGALLEAQSMGLSVPRDVSVTGFDDLAIAREIAPRLTTIHAPVEEMGWLAANYLLGKDGEAALTPYVRIDADGITVIAPRAEMGQGVSTTLAALVAEELDVALEDINVEHGPASKEVSGCADVGCHGHQQHQVQQPELQPPCRKRRGRRRRGKTSPKRR